MTPERWRQVTAIFHAARVREPERRPALLDQMCGPDVSLRAEVESMLAAQADASHAGARTAIDFLPQLSPGTAFGMYRVEALIGSGGMGQVYRATDTRLRRTVALKVLAPGLADDGDFHARFEREARVLASLSHPNVAAIHGVEDADGVRALVLEFVEGPTLAERLATGHLPSGEALAIAKQIALALEAAHEKGIIHRDLKPANVKITPNGIVKVLDFGIARAGDGQGAVAITAGATGTGLILGTPAYMSPEQARGLPVDKRTDIWAFGCVLFEMLAGRGAFTAETASDSLAKVIEREPDWRALPPELPPPIHRLVVRCLRKDAADRQRDIADARIEIDEAIDAAARSVASTNRQPDRTGTWAIPIVVGAVALLAVTAWAIWHAGASSEASSSTSSRVEFGITFPNAFIPAQGIALSPDGRRLAAGVFANAPQIWIHSFQTSETRPLPGGEGAYPFWSPDSTRIGFFRLGAMYLMNPDDGIATPIVQNLNGVTGAAWNHAGVILYGARGRLFRVSESGGAPVELALQNPDGLPASPSFLPDGRHFVFYAYRGISGSVRLGSLDSDQVTTLVESDRPGTFAPPDRLVFVRNATILSQRLDLGRLVLDGAPEIVASGATSGVLGPLTLYEISASTNGLLAFPAPRGGSSGRLTWFSREGKPAESIESPSFNAEYVNAVISPDGKTVAANLINSQTGDSDIWLIDTVRNVPSKLTTESASESDPVWSPDGKEIAYLSDRGGRYALYVQPVAGGAAREILQLGDTPTLVMPTDWSPDGRYLLYQQLAAREWGMWAVPLSGDHKPFRMTGDQKTGYGGHLSPDGKWLAYAAFESDQFEIFVRRFPEGTPKKQISHGGGTHPRWTRDGKELVYWAPPRGIFANDITVTGSDISVGPMRTLVDRPVLSLIDGRPHYDITRDGQRLLVRQPLGPPRPGIRVLLNWMSKPAK